MIPSLCQRRLRLKIENSWSNFGVNVDGVRLNHLRFADDIVLITDSPEHASEMLRTFGRRREPLWPHYQYLQDQSDAKSILKQRFRTSERKSNRRRQRVRVPREPT